MTGPSLDEFAGCVQSLDPERLTQFVAHLYAVRGYHTEVTGTDRVLVTAPEGGTGGSRAIRVATSVPAGPVPEQTVVVARQTDVESVGDADVVDVRALHRMALYAIEPDHLTALSAEYFGGNWDVDRDGEGATAGEGALGDHAGRLAPQVEPPVVSLGDVPVGGLSVLFVVALLVVLAAVTVGPYGGIATGPGVERTVTPVPVSTQQDAATPTDGPGRRATAPCPTAPADAHPASFRPVPVDAALSTGLESWEYRLSLNFSVFYGPSPLQIRWKPDLRHESTYRTPEGEAIVLTIDRWNGSTAAARAGRALAAEYGLSAVWGRYTFTITYNSEAQNTSVEQTTARATSRLLLSRVTTSEGVKLGQTCLDTLVVDRTD